MKNKDTVNLTCRMEKMLYDIISNAAEEQGISLNSLMNSIIRKYISWERYTERIGFVPLSKRAIAQLFNNLDMPVIKKIANDIGSTLPKEMLYLTSDEINFSNITNLVAAWGNRLGAVKCSNGNSTGTTNITIHHGISKNFSEYVAELHRAMAVSLLFNLKIIAIDDNFVSMSIKE